MLILYPRLPNGNVLWNCDGCDDTAEVSFAMTAAVALYCSCNHRINPRCNDDWYNKSLYLSRIPMKKREGYHREIRTEPIKIKKQHERNETNMRKIINTVLSEHFRDNPLLRGVPVRKAWLDSMATDIITKLRTKGWFLDLCEPNITADASGRSPGTGKA